ncbi:MAG: ABC transporter substrate-binding protein [Paludibacteraceae bacterium]
MRRNLFIALCGLILLSCNNTNQTNHSLSQSPNSLKLTYAKGFTINTHADYKEVTVFNPWKQGEIYARYFLVRDKNVKTPADGVKIQIPIKKMASSSATHLSFLDLLGEIHTVSGFCKPSLAYNDTFLKNVQNGKIIDLGEEFTMNIEKTVVLQPALLMTSGYNQTDANVQRIQQTGIPVVYNVEWMETSPLGRAEWIKFVAAFFDKETLADTIFTQTETRYNKLRTRLLQIKDRPRILTGGNFRGTWYMPSGRSFMGELYRDAGADYFYAHDTTGGSLPLNFETVLKNFSDADIWLNCPYNSIDELMKADGRNKLFLPVKKSKIYNFNKRMSPSGANDFWESGVSRPDLLLSDIVFILHPNILPNHQLYFAHQLKP